MTRINVIPVCELSDQHLIAEYRELPRVIKQDINIDNAPTCYTLGTGHMRWARRHWQYTYERFVAICNEMQFRGFKTNFEPTSLLRYMDKCKNADSNYTVQNNDIILNRTRIRAKYNIKPNFYRWTRRNKPNWL